MCTARSSSQAPPRPGTPQTRHLPDQAPPRPGTPGSRHPTGPGTPPGPDQAHPPGAGTPHGQTHACKHITLPQTSFAGRKNPSWYISDDFIKLRIVETTSNFYFHFLLFKDQLMVLITITVRGTTSKLQFREAKLLFQSHRWERRELYRRLVKER